MIADYEFLLDDWFKVSPVVLRSSRREYPISWILTLTLASTIILVMTNPWMRIHLGTNLAAWHDVVEWEFNSEISLIGSVPYIYSSVYIFCVFRGSHPSFLTYFSFSFIKRLLSFPFRILVSHYGDWMSREGTCAENENQNYICGQNPNAAQYKFKKFIC